MAYVNRRNSVQRALTPSRNLRSNASGTVRLNSTLGCGDLLSPANNGRNPRVTGSVTDDPDKENQLNTDQVIQNTWSETSNGICGKNNWDVNLDRLGYSDYCQKPRRKLDGVTGGGKAKRRLVAQQKEMENVLNEGRSGSLESGGRIMVHVRIRPLSQKENQAGARSCVRIINGKDIYITEFADEKDYFRLRRANGRYFTFDSTIPDTSSQQEVYDITTSELVETVLEGKNGTVFCYGATGAGKTFTMLGTVNNPGVMVLAIKDLFERIRQRGLKGNHSVRLSYVEIYNETLRDLLSPGSQIHLREDKQGPVTSGLTQFQAYTITEVMELLQKGHANRTTEPTAMNQTSSRSHAILQVIVDYRTREGSSVVCRQGKLSLIDLAGSERASATEPRTMRSVEGANINRSLLALSTCINALVAGKKHIPYRNSKLTQLLKDSLGGPCHTVMIANISPNNHNFGETQNTLYWADRAKEVRTKACIAKEETNIPEDSESQAKLLEDIQKENQLLRMQLVQYKQKIIKLENQIFHAGTSHSVTPPRKASLTYSPLTSSTKKASSPKQVLSQTPKSVTKTVTSVQDNPKTPQHESGTKSVTVSLHVWAKSPNSSEDLLSQLNRKIATMENDFTLKEKMYMTLIKSLEGRHSPEIKETEDFIRQPCQIDQSSKKDTTAQTPPTTSGTSRKPTAKKAESDLTKKAKSVAVQRPLKTSIIASSRLQGFGAAGLRHDLTTSNRIQPAAASSNGKKSSFPDTASGGGSTSVAVVEPSIIKSQTTAPAAAQTSSKLLELGCSCFWVMIILAPAILAYLSQPELDKQKP